jgi:predicted deacylase
MATTELVMPAAGQRHEGELTSDLPVLEGWSWPYVTITGQEDGPLATIIAGIHGCEYVSIRAAVRLARELDPREVRGRVLVVPIVNLPSFWERTPFVCPIDGVNPNRIFPGNPDGTFTEAMAHLIFQTCIAPSDVFIDLHGGDMVEELATFTGYASDAAPEVTGKARAMAEAFGLDYTIGRPQQTGPRSGLTHMAAARNGVAGVLAEAGGIGQLTLPEVDILVDGTRRALQVAGNLPGEPVPPPTRHITKSVTVFAPAAGFWICDVRAGDEVREGQRLGQILSLLGDVIETVEAPQDGFVIYRTTSAAVKPDGLLVNIGA